MALKMGDIEPITRRECVVLATTRWNGHKKVNGTVLHTIERKGVVLLYIIEVSEVLVDMPT